MTSADRVTEMVAIEQRLRDIAAQAVELTGRMMNIGIFTNSLQDVYVSAEITADVVSKLADQSLLATAATISTGTVQ